jgi:hypothetical protein
MNTAAQLESLFGITPTAQIPNNTNNLINTFINSQATNVQAKLNGYISGKPINLSTPIQVSADNIRFVELKLNPAKSYASPNETMLGGTFKMGMNLSNIVLSQMMNSIPATPMMAMGDITIKMAPSNNTTEIPNITDIMISNVSFAQPTMMMFGSSALSSVAQVLNQYKSVLEPAINGYLKSNIVVASTPIVGPIIIDNYYPYHNRRRYSYDWDSDDSDSDYGYRKKSWGGKSWKGRSHGGKSWKGKSYGGGWKGKSYGGGWRGKK